MNVLLESETDESFMLLVVRSHIYYTENFNHVDKEDHTSIFFGKIHKDLLKKIQRDSQNKALKNFFSNFSRIFICNFCRRFFWDHPFFWGFSSSFFWCSACSSFCFIYLFIFLEIHPKSSTITFQGSKWKYLRDRITSWGIFFRNKVLENSFPESPEEPRYFFSKFYRWHNNFSSQVKTMIL